MEIVIKSREFEADPQTKEIILKKSEKIKRHYSGAQKLEIEINREGNPSIADSTSVELTLSVKKQLIRASCNGENLVIAIDKAVSKINRQLEKHKAKIYRSSVNHHRQQQIQETQETQPPVE